MIELLVLPDAAYYGYPAHERTRLPAAAAAVVVVVVACAYHALISSMPAQVH